MGKINSTLEGNFALKSKPRLTGQFKEFGLNATIQKVSNEHGFAYIACYHLRIECKDREFNIKKSPRILGCKEIL